jgi:hypothetical protein
VLPAQWYYEWGEGSKKSEQAQTTYSARPNRLKKLVVEEDLNGATVWQVILATVVEL